MSDESHNLISRARKYNWKPLLPIVAILIAATLWLPNTGNPSFFSLELHQQIVSASTLPVSLVSMYWFLKENDMGKRSPEERILNDD